MEDKLKHERYYADMEKVWSASYPSVTSIAEVEAFYLESGYEGGFRPYLEKLLSNRELQFKRGRVLDFGCDTGIMLNYFKGRSLELYGVDINREALRRGRALYPDFNLIRVFGLEIPFVDKYFDLVYLSAVLKHIRFEDREGFYRELERVADFFIVCEVNSEGDSVEEYEGFKFYHSDFSRELVRYFDQLELLRVGGDILALYRTKNG